jgi:hypothetical protein
MLATMDTKGFKGLSPVPFQLRCLMYSISPDYSRRNINPKRKRGVDKELPSLPLRVSTIRPGRHERDFVASPGFLMVGRLLAPNSLTWTYIEPRFSRSKAPSLPLRSAPRSHRTDASKHKRAMSGILPFAAPNRLLAVCPISRQGHCEIAISDIKSLESHRK